MYTKDIEFRGLAYKVDIVGNCLRNVVDRFVVVDILYTIFIEAKTYLVTKLRIDLVNNRGIYLLVRGTELSKTMSTHLRVGIIKHSKEMDKRKSWFNFFTFF